MIYKLKSNIIISILLLLIFSGCGYKQTNTQIRDISFLKFNKSPDKGYKVIINGKYKFKLDSNIIKENNIVDNLYEVKSGNSIIKVFDTKNNLIIKKEIYIGSSNTLEINLP
jgi:uncharacterized membrane protein